MPNEPATSEGKQRHVEKPGGARHVRELYIVVLLIMRVGEKLNREPNGAQTYFHRRDESRVY